MLLNRVILHHNRATFLNRVMLHNRATLLHRVMLHNRATLLHRVMLHHNRATLLHRVMLHHNRATLLHRVMLHHNRATLLNSLSHNLFNMRGLVRRHKTRSTPCLQHRRIQHHHKLMPHRRLKVLEFNTFKTKPPLFKKEAVFLKG
jgi:hypothetical protein